MRQRPGRFGKGELVPSRPGSKRWRARFQANHRQQRERVARSTRRRRWKRQPRLLAHSRARFIAPLRISRGERGAESWSCRANSRRNRGYVRPARKRRGGARRDGRGAYSSTARVFFKVARELIGKKLPCLPDAPGPRDAARLTASYLSGDDVGRRGIN